MSDPNHPIEVGFPLESYRMMFLDFDANGNVIEAPSEYDKYVQWLNEDESR